MLECIEVQIPKGRTLRVRNARHCQLRVAEGTLWITEERNPTDYVVASGDSCRVTNAGLALAYAFDDTRLEITAAAGSLGMPAFQLGGGYNEYAAAVWGTQLRAAAGWMARRFEVSFPSWTRRFPGKSAILTIRTSIPSRPASGSRPLMR
jgi:hypothetical protein